MYVWYVHVYFCVQPVTQGSITGYQVDNNGTIMNATSSTTTLTFTAPSIDIDNHPNITTSVMVRAVNQFGIGPNSDPATDQIDGTYVFM